MPASPVYDETVSLRASAVKHVQVFAALDRGCSLTKIVFLPKGNATTGEVVSFRCLTFLNAHFEDALLVLRDQAQLPASGKLHCTGIGGEIYRNKIEEIIGLEPVNVPEHLTIGPGVFLTLTNSEENDIFYPTAPHKSYIIQNEKLKELFEAFSDSRSDSDATEEDSLFPAIVLYIGSGGGSFNIDAQGKFTFNMSNQMGKIFIGLASLLIGTTDYDEIMTLASKGDRRNVCQTIGDISENQGIPSLGEVPLDMPAFAFGKATLDNFDRSKVSREDLAASLVGYYAAGICSELNNLSELTSIRRFYIAGNFARSEFLRSQILETDTCFPPYVNIRFIRTGHTGAIGAMLLKEDEANATWAKKKRKSLPCTQNFVECSEY